MTPIGRFVTARMAEPPELTAPLPSATPLEEKVTVPEGDPCDAVTRAVKVTAVPAVAVATEAERTLLVLAADTLMVIGGKPTKNN